MTSDQEPAPAPKTKHRSPNYPAFNLEKAIEKVRLLHAKARTSAVPVTIACDYLEVKSTSSSGMRCISALQEFGLAEAEGRGPGKTLRVTETARTLLKHPDKASTEYKAALRTAALRPKIHAKIWAKWSDDLPPNEAIVYELASPDWGFADQAAAAVVAEFRQTIDFAGLTSEPPEDDTGGEDGPPPGHPREEHKASDAPSGDDGKTPKTPGTWMPATTDTSKIIPLPLQSGSVATLHLPHLLDEQDYGWVRNLLDVLKASMLAPPPTETPQRPSAEDAEEPQ